MKEWASKDLTTEGVTEADVTKVKEDIVTVVTKKRNEVPNAPKRGAKGKPVYVKILDDVEKIESHEAELQNMDSATSA